MRARLTREEDLRLANKFRLQRDRLVKAAKEVENAYYIVPRNSARLRAAMDALVEFANQFEGDET